MFLIFYIGVFMSFFLLSFPQNCSGVTFYSDYHKGAHPILNTKEEIEKVFEPINDYLARELSKNLDEKVTRIFIVRHTESLANSQGINAGRMDFSLSEKGRQDAEKIGEQLAKQMQFLKIDAVYCTSLKRTVETYQQMAKGWERQPGEALPEPQTADALIERNNGLLEGMRKEEYEPLKKNEAVALEKIVDFDELFDYKIPEGGEKYESLHDVWNRAVPALNEIARKHPGKNVLVISHVGTMRALIEGCAAAKEQPVTLNYRKYDIKNGSLLAITSNGFGINLEAVSPFDYEKNKK